MAKPPKSRWPRSWRRFSKPWKAAGWSAFTERARTRRGRRVPPPSSSVAGVRPRLQKIQDFFVAVADFGEAGAWDKTIFCVKKCGSTIILFASHLRAELVCGTMLWRRFIVFSVGAMLCCPALAGPAVTNVLSDDELLNEIEKRSFQFFLKEAEPNTGLVPDRAGADGSWRENVSSVAATGFGLAALCIGAERGWIARTDAVARVVRTLKFARDRLAQEHGIFYHFVSREMGDRMWGCEVSPMDTALFLCGALVARQYFAVPLINQLVAEIYGRVDWPWMLDGGTTLRLGWLPERGFDRQRWDAYAEHMVMYLLGLGAPERPLPAACWDAWRRTPVGHYAGMTYLQLAPLFVHQYSQAFVDFRDRHDGYADYWRNSELATRAQRQLCLDLRDKFPHYGPDCWGITSSDSPTGYRAWGGPPPTPDVDGVVVPCAAGGSLPFAPPECLAVLRQLVTTYGERVWKPYGFVDAFNPRTGWYSPDVLGIDVGITLLMAENFRSGLIWRQFMSAPEIQRALKLARFRPTTPQMAATWPSTTAILPGGRIEGAPAHDQPRRALAVHLPRLERDWDWQTLNAVTACERLADVEENFSARFAFAWDETVLRFRCEVFDPTLVNAVTTENWAAQDCLELYVAPGSAGWTPGATNTVHAGFAPNDKEPEWPQGTRLRDVKVEVTPTGYRVVAAIPWTLLDVTPQAGLTLSCTPVANNIVRKDEPVGKLWWRWHEHGPRVELGALTLEKP
ncbi:MAG: hypothetical protein EPN23_10015 [Verrucomicrobia bacterium]|nr:MAG: hypothetical protein EPN23_10015 [Verrucomicrobiota bacterium]